MYIKKETMRTITKKRNDLFMRYLNIKPKFGKGGFYEYGDFIKDGMIRKDLDCNTFTITGWVCVGYRKKEKLTRYKFLLLLTKLGL